MIQEIMRKTRIESVMAKPIKTVNERDDFYLVLDKMVTFDIRHLAVVNDGGHLTGLITQRHLYKVHSPRKLEDGSWYYDKDVLNEFILKNVMITDPFTLTADQTLYDAVQGMVDQKYGCVIIIDASRHPIGILTRSDVLKFILSN